MPIRQRGRAGRSSVLRRAGGGTGRRTGRSGCRSARAGPRCRRGPGRRASSRGRRASSRGRRAASAMLSQMAAWAAWFCLSAISNRLVPSTAPSIASNPRSPRFWSPRPSVWSISKRSRFWFIRNAVPPRGQALAATRRAPVGSVPDATSKRSRFNQPACQAAGPRATRRQRGRAGRSSVRAPSQVAVEVVEPAAQWFDFRTFGATSKRSWFELPDVSARWPRGPLVPLDRVEAAPSFLPARSVAKPSNRWFTRVEP